MISFPSSFHFFRSRILILMHSDRQMDKPKETIRFLDNFDITLSLDNRSDGGHTLTNIDVNIQPLVLRVSFRDLLLIQNIINRAIEMSTRAASPPPRPNLATLASQKSTKTITSTTKSTGTRRRSSVGGLAAQIIMTKENVSILSFYLPVSSYQTLCFY
jgi:vacuolar protein sorting-associated protein 13A/C